MDQGEAIGGIDSAKATTNLWGERWSKLVQNAMGNGVTAATGLTSPDCGRNERIRRFQIALAGEAIRVGQALGYTLEKVRALEPEKIDALTTERTRQIVLTNLHNPSGVLTDDETLREIGTIARRVGARVLVNEVYLETLFEATPRTSFHLGSEFVVSNV